MLLAVAKINPHWTFHGQDIDIRCVRMTAINLAYRNLRLRYARDTLRNERRLIYQTGFKGGIRPRGADRETPRSLRAPRTARPLRFERDTEPPSELTTVVQGSLFD